MQIFSLQSLMIWWQRLQKSAQFNQWISIIILVVINAIAFFGNLGATGLIDETEPLFAESARQMLVRNDWITPYVNGETRFDKPILIYWLIAIAYRFLGVNSWAVRFPSAIAATLLSVFCFFTLWRFGTSALGDAPKSPKKQQLRWILAWIGSALTSLNLLTIVWARLGVADMLLSSCMGISLFCFFWGYATHPPSSQARRDMGMKAEIDPPSQSGKTQNLWQDLLSPMANRWYLAFYVWSALAVLTKGPIGIVLPGLIILIFLLYMGSFRKILAEIGIIRGFGIFVLITFPWYILVTLTNGYAFLNAFFGYHNFQRFTEVVNQHSASWYFYFLIILALFAPWSIYLPSAIIRLGIFHRKRWQYRPRQDHLGIFAFFWFVGILFFFTIAVTKLPHYVLPLIPAAAILVALLWGELFISPAQPLNAPRTGLFFSIVCNIALLVAFVIGLLFLPNLVGTDAAMQQVSVFLQTAKFPLYGAIIWGVAAIACLWLLKRRQNWRWIIAVNIVGFLLFFMVFGYPGYALMDQTRQLPLRQLSAVVKQVKQPEEKIMMVGFKKSSVTFYSRQSVGYFWSLNPEAIAFLETIPKSSTLLLIGEIDQITSSGLDIEDYQIISQKAPYQLIRLKRETLWDDEQ